MTNTTTKLRKLRVLFEEDRAFFFWKRKIFSKESRKKLVNLFKKKGR